MSDTSTSGVVVVDKPSGPTSHDIVHRIRRTLCIRSVGHAGTLDPLATGVLVVMIGEATKLSQFLTLEDKAYLATVEFGATTDTLDAAGRVTGTQPVPEAIHQALEAIENGHPDAPEAGLVRAALEHEITRELQVPPQHSAIKQSGARAYEHARRGENLELAARLVRVLEMQLGKADAARHRLDVLLTVSKGYYVRSFARDLGAALGVPTHLAALRRLRSGPFDLSRAVEPDASAQQLAAMMVGLADAARLVMPTVVLTREGVLRAGHGQPMAETDFAERPNDAPTAWLTPDGTLVAIGDRSRGRPTVLRAFSSGPAMC